jgi:hypothetical protein
MQSNPGTYYSMRNNILPAFAWKGFAIAFLGTDRFAAQSDGTSLEIDAGQDLAARIGFAQNFVGNLLKLGVSVTALQRNQLKGTFAHAALDSNDSMQALMNEGLGFSANAGVLFTWPMQYLPTIGFSVHDIGGMTFQRNPLLNTRAAGTPEAIPMTYHAGFSMQPRFSKSLRSVLTVDIRHLERTDLELTKKLHFGLQIEWSGSFFTWVGANQLLPTFGMGMRLSGGNLELGAYGVDIGPAGTRQADTRFLMRYTIGF